MIGAFSIIGPNVTLGDRVRLHSHVVIDGHTTIGDGTEIYPFAVLGANPQHTRYDGEDSTLVIGNNNIIREHVTMHPGTAIDAMTTIVGDNGYFMAATHVAHDCIVGDNVIFANNATIGGHVKIGNHVMLGGFASVQQWCCVGDHAMIGSQSAVDRDVVPFVIAVGNRARLSGINKIGLARRGFSPDEIDTVRQAFKVLFLQNGLLRDRITEARETFADDLHVQQMLVMIDNAGRNGICQAETR